jgi:hypothetical protein
MGPVRGGLILACLVLPGPALAEVCARLRPDWDGGPVGPVADAIALFSSLPALALLLGTALAIRLRHQGLALGVVVLWTVLVSFAALRGGQDGVWQAAATEGCVGSPSLFIALAAAISVGTILYTSRRPRQD